jgi:pyruvate dehydrogenase E1 component
VSTTIPNCVAYDPTFAYELAVIIQDGMRRMFAEQEDVFYYLSVMNENYDHPAMPKGAEAGILKGMYLLRSGGKGKVRVNLFGSGTILREVIKAAEILEKDYGVPSDIFSATSFSELRREALDVERKNMLHPDQPAAVPYVRQLLGDRTGPFIAATDNMRIVPDQIRQWVPGRYVVLGTDGYGRSDSRAQLRKHFEVDAPHIVVASLRALVDEGKLDVATVKAALKKFNIDPDKPNPVTQ